AGDVLVPRSLPARRTAALPRDPSPAGGAAGASRRLLPPGRVSDAPALEVVDLVKHYDGEGRLFGSKEKVHAVDGVSFTLERGEILGLVGESGSGKSTAAHCVARLLEPTSGSIRLEGNDITHLSHR